MPYRHSPAISTYYASSPFLSAVFAANFPLRSAFLTISQPPLPTHHPSPHTYCSIWYSLYCDLRCDTCVWECSEDANIVRLYFLKTKVRWRHALYFPLSFDVTVKWRLEYWTAIEMWQNITVALYKASAMIAQILKVIVLKETLYQITLLLQTLNSQRHSCALL